MESRKATRFNLLAKTYNAAVITLTIDEDGMAKDREKKLEVAKRFTTSPSTTTDSSLKTWSTTR
jgi:cobalamin-dependent methionine synthase I